MHYILKENTCRPQVRKDLPKLKGFARIQFGNERMLAEVIRKVGPVTISIHITPKFQFYREGIYIDPACGNSIDVLNHAVVAVGYGEVSQGKYYIMRNSWGTKWGKNGYLFMPRDMNNHCGVASYAIYPLV